MKEAVQQACFDYLREHHHQFTMGKAGPGGWRARERETYLKGGIDGALQLIDDDILYRIAFTGVPKEVRQRVEEYRKLGISLAVIRLRMLSTVGYRQRRPSFQSLRTS